MYPIWFFGGEGVTTNPGIVQLPLYPEDALRGRSIIPKASPFIKWAGGKRKLIDYIFGIAPDSFDRYVEPFLGGGAVGLALGYHTMLLNDANVDLINTFCIVRDSLETLLPLLDEHQKRHSKDYFYIVRAQDPTKLNPIEQAARFIYLNKTCFNGLYRVNKLGQFNVPFGKYKNSTLYNREDIQVASNVLQGAELFAQDYQTFLRQQARPGDLIYLDPPYVPVSQFSDFKRYTKEQFRENDQYVLAQLYNELVELGAYPVLSNSYSELTLDLYAQHQILIVYASRNINHEGTGRDPIPEILVKTR
jgi:DNA adenine methylase